MADNFVSYCPRCDKAFWASTQLVAINDVKAHLARQVDDLHDGALQAWIEDE